MFALRNLKFNLISRYSNALSYSSSKVQLPSAMNFVNGERVVPCSSETFEVKEPGSGKVLGMVQCSGEQDVNIAVQSASKVLEEWSTLAWCDRAPILQRAAKIIRERQNELAIMDTIDTGRNINEIEYDIACGADTLDYYAALATTNVDQYVKLPNGTFSYITKEPYGVVGAIGSWNFPFLGATWKVAPGLVSGNAIVFKPSPLAPIITPVLAEIFHQAGLPSGLFNVIQGAATTGTLLCKHARISKLSFTGGIETGKKVLEACASGIKPVTLELGGKSPLIIFPDCNLDNAVNAALNANLELGGESCTNGTRVFVHESIKERFVAQVLGRMRQIKVGNPIDREAQMGAMISEDHLVKVLDYIQSAKNEVGWLTNYQ